jgi:hypothetical protein
MIITITPEDIIRRCLWSEFRKFIFKTKNETEISELIEKNQPFSLTENDAFVIGLLKVVETENLLHRFKLHITETLEIKSSLQEIGENKDKKVMINKSTIMYECISFKERFPYQFDKDIYFNKNVEELIEYINRKYQELDKLETTTLNKIINGQTKKVIYLSSNQVKKLF